MVIVKAKKFTASGVISSSACALCGFLLGTDGVNDPVITFFDGISAVDGKEVVPTTTYESSTNGLNGFMPGSVMIDCPNGLYVEVATIGTGEGVAYVRPM
jgi:hypothetical protein